MFDKFNLETNIIQNDWKTVGLRDSFTNAQAQFHYDKLEKYNF